jgi:type I restriction enzyme, S subunit
MTCNQACCALIVHEDSADSRYLFYQLLFNRDRLRNLAVGAAQQNLSAQVIGDLQLPFPPLADQRAIGAALGAIDDKIDINRRIAESLEQVARVLFESWFVDFDPMRGTSTVPQDIRRLFPDKLVESRIGLVPGGWEVTTVGDVCLVNDETLRAHNLPETIEYIDISAATDRMPRPTRIDREDAPSRARRRVKHGDTVLSTVRPERGAHFLALQPAEELIVSTGFAVLTPSSVPWSFLFAAMSRPQVFERLGQLASGAAYPAVRPRTIAELPLVVPPQRLLTAYHDVASPILEQAALSERESETLGELRDTLLPKLISGEVRPGTAGDTSRKLEAATPAS